MKRLRSCKTTFLSWRPIWWRSRSGSRGQRDCRAHRRRSIFMSVHSLALLQSKTSAQNALQELGRLLVVEGYAEVCASILPVSPLLSSWRDFRECVPSGLAALLDLFLLNRAVRPD